MPRRSGSGRKQTPVLGLFKEVVSTGKLPRVMCTFCTKELAKSGSRMEMHMQQCLKCPASVKRKYLSKKKIEKGKSDVSHTDMISIPQSSLESSVQFTSQCKQQILSFVDKVSAADQLKANGLLARAIYASGTPLSMVENPYWQQFFKFVRPALKLPSRYQISGPLLQQEYTSVHDFVEEKLAQADSVAIICDGWSNIRNESMVNFILTTPTPILYKILATGKESHTAEYIARQIQEVINKIGIQKVFGVVTDNAANMKAAWAILRTTAESGNFNLFTYGCVAHSLNLIFSDLKKLHTVHTFLAQVVSLVKTIRQSHLMLALFKEKQSKGNEISLKLPVATRWGSVVHCLESVQANKQAIMSLAIDDSVQELIKKHPDLKKNALDDTFWDKVEGFISLLKPVATAITFFESDKTHISLVIRVFKQLEEHFLQASSLCPLLKQEKAKAAEIIRDRRNFAVSDVHRICNLLDPSTKGSDLTPFEQTDAIETIFETAKRSPDVDEKIVLNDLANFQAKSGFFSKSFLWTAASDISTTAWWKGFCSFTELSKLAYRFLDLPASSASCERSFSTYEGIHTPKRNRLNNDRAAKLVYIRHNLKLNSEINNCEATTTSTFGANPTPKVSIMEDSALPSTSSCAVLASTSNHARTNRIDAEGTKISNDSDSEETLISSSDYSLHDTDTSEDPEDFEY